MKSLPANWFLKGDDSPGSGGQSTSLSDPYAGSSWVFAACNLIADPITQAELTFTNFDGVEIEDRSLYDFWERPARTAHETMTRDEMISLTVAIRGIYGSCFWILDDSWLMNTVSNYNRIILAAPRQMIPVYDDRTLSGWIYQGANGYRRTFLKEQVLHLRLPNPADPDSLDGIAPWMPAKTSAEAAKAGTKFAKRVMDKNGDMGSTIIVKGGCTPEQREMLKTEMRERRRAVARDEYRDSVIGGDVEISTPSISAISSDFAGQIEMSRDEIAVAYAVPPSLMSMVANYSIGASSDLYRLITGPSTREAKVIASAIQRVSEYRLGYRSLAQEIAGRETTGRDAKKSIFAQFDFSGHPAMEEVRVGRVSSVKELFSVGVPVEVANDFLNLGMPSFPGWEKSYLPFSLAEQTGAKTPAAPSTDSGAKSRSVSAGLDEVADLVRQWSHRRSTLVTTRQSADRLALWKKIDRARTGDRKKVKNAVGNQLMKARAETLANLKKNREALEKSLSSPDTVTRAGALDIVFNLVEWSRGFVGTMHSLLADIFVGAGNDFYDEVEGDFDPMTEADPVVVAYLRDRDNKMKDVADEVHQDLVASLEEGISAGETFDELTARVRALFTEISKVKAETIARTETGAAYETARYHSMKVAGVTKKGWLSGGDDGVTRATHQAADGQSRGIDEFFEVGSAKLLHPADHIHGADYPEELVNCRCVLVAEA